MIKLSTIVFLLIIISTAILKAEAQIQTVVKEDFTIRDFVFENDTISYIKKRMLHQATFSEKLSKNIFLSGYGLKIFLDPEKRTMVIASNELVENVSTVRFINKNRKETEEIFYNYSDKITDMVFVPDREIFILSLISKKIIVIDYSEKPKFSKIIEIKTNALSRKMRYDNGILYYATDSGGLFKYELDFYKKNKIYSGKGKITDFIIDDNFIYVAYIEGTLIKYNRLEKIESSNIVIEDSFITTLIDDNDNLIFGCWNGEVMFVNKETFNISIKFKIHDKAILNIKKYRDSIFYSSGVDKKILKWRLPNF